MDTERNMGGLYVVVVVVVVIFNRRNPTPSAAALSSPRKVLVNWNSLIFGPLVMASFMCGFCVSLSHPQISYSLLEEDASV